MKLNLCILFTFITASLLGTWTWARSLGGDSMERVWDIETDASSNIYLIGDFADSLCVNGQSYAGYGVSDSFVMKFSSSGAFIWAQTFGSVAEDSAISVATDPLGNCYVSGYFVDTLRVQEQSVVSNGGWDTYIVKLDPQGELLWLRSFGGPLNDIAYGLAVSPLGRVYVAGWFADSISFPGGSSIVSAGGSDIFCLALDLAGDYLWSRRAGTAGVDYGYQVAADEDGNAYVTGVAGMGAIFGPFALSSNGMYVTKLDPQGQFLWLNSGANGAVVNIAIQAETGASQSGMVCGRLSQDVTYGEFSYSPINESDDAYYATFDANTGQWLELNTFGGAWADNGKDVDLSFDPVIVFNFEGSADFGDQTFNSSGERDLVLAYGFPDLQFVSAGGQFSEVPSCIKQLPNGKIMIAGWHFGSFQLGAWNLDSGNSSNQNAFLACFDPAVAVDDDLIAVPSPIEYGPNPFSTELKLKLNKADSSSSKLKIYNLRGQLIRNLEPDSAGKTEAFYSWDGRDQAGKICSAGIYLIRWGTSCCKVLLNN